MSSEIHHERVETKRVFCPGCGAAIPADAFYCPYCTRRLKEHPSAGPRPLSSAASQPPPSPPTPAPVRQKFSARHPEWFTFLWVAGVLAVALLGYLWLAGRPNHGRTAPPADGPVIQYLVEGTQVDRISVTLRNDTGGVEQGEFPLPLSRFFHDFERGDFVYVSAQIVAPEYAGAITCRILGPGGVLAESKASGFPSIATCSGRVP